MPGLVTARSGAGTFSPPQADFFGGLPEQRYGKTFPFVYRGMGTGREGEKAEGCCCLKKSLNALLFLTFSALVANPKKTTLHGGQSRSWSAEQGKKEREKV